MASEFFMGDRFKHLIQLNNLAGAPAYGSLSAALDGGSLTIRVPRQFGVKLG
jgi:hypothetical protein